MIINISKALKLSLVFAVCAGQGVYAMNGISSLLNKVVSQPIEGLMAKIPSDRYSRELPVIQSIIGVLPATSGLYFLKKDGKKTKFFSLLSGLVGTGIISINLNRQNPELPASLFGSVGGALNFLGAQNFNQCLAYGAVAAGCGFVNPVLREMITQNPKLAAGFAGAAVLGKIAHFKIRYYYSPAAAASRTVAKKSKK